MKIIRVSIEIFVTLVCILLKSCKKEHAHIFTTSDIINISGTTASGGGSITSEWSGTVIGLRVYCGTETNTSLKNNKTSDGAGMEDTISLNCY